MKQCTCYALRAIDCTCKPAKYGELYTSPTAKQEQGEPVVFKDKIDNIRMTIDASAPIVVTPHPSFAQQRTWEGLSVFEINDLVENTEYEDYSDLIERTEAKLKEKNG